MSDNGLEATRSLQGWRAEVKGRMVDEVDRGPVEQDQDHEGYPQDFGVYKGNIDNFSAKQ